MGRTWLALVVVALAGAPAHAKRAPECECAQTETFPSYGTVDVPTNQRAIELRPFDDKEPIKITSLGDLQPNTDYHLDSPISLSFKTGAAPDLHVPQAPTNVNPSIAIARSNVKRGASDWIKPTGVSMEGDYDDDTTYLEVELTAGDGTTAHFAMHRYNPFMCGAPLDHLTIGPVNVKVWAIDRTGNRSEQPWTGVATFRVIDEDPTEGMCIEHHVRCGMGAMIAVFAAAILIFLELIVLAIAQAIRRARMRKWPGEHVTIPHGESVARLAARAYTIKLAVSIAGVASLWKLDHPITAVLIAPLALLWFIEMVIARGVVHRFNSPVNRLERRDDWLLVDHTLLYCGRRAWSRAAHVPTATIAKKRDGA